MDYKKAYEDALERAKGIYNENPSSSTAKFVCGQIFPEIKESEDERIRKRLIDCLKFSLKGAEEQDAAGCSRQKDIEAYKWGIAYIEKQKAQQPAELNDAERKQLYSDGFDTARKALANTFMQYLDEHRPEGKMCLSNGECAALAKAFKVGDVETIVRYINKYQQPAEFKYSDDEKLFQLIEDVIRVYGKTQGKWIGGVDMDTLVMFLRRLREKQPAKWNKEDELHLKNAILAAEKEWGADSRTAEWLKALQPNWKPSEEQMDALRIAYEIGTANESWAMCVLKSLYNDLKKMV